MRNSIGLAMAIPTLLLVLSGCISENDSSSTPTDVPEFQVVTPTPVPSPTPRTDTVIYVVQEGDTVIDIALKFDVEEGAIVEANGLTNPNSLFVGQQLSIPPPDAATPTD